MKRFLTMAAVLLAMARVSLAQATPTPTPNVVIAVTPTTASVALGGTVDVVIQVQAGSRLVDGAAGYIDFDHTALQVASISAGTSLPVVLANTFDNGAGTINYAAGTFSGEPSGTFTLATVHFTALAIGTTSLTFHSTNPRKTDATYGGASIFNSAVGGSVVVSAAAATATPTATSPPTSTPTLRPPPPCCGDCDGNGIVTQTEVATCVSIFSGALPLTACPACDCTGDGIVRGNDITTAVHNEGVGCPTAPLPGAPAQESCNAAGTDAGAWGQLHIHSGVRAPLNLPMPTVGPTPNEGDVWPDPNAHKWCFRHYGTTYCSAAFAAQ